MFGSRSLISLEVDGDASGEQVLDYTITSESGWEPMYGPGPGFGVLLASGVLALSLVASSPRRRSRSRSPTRG